MSITDCNIVIVCGQEAPLEVQDRGGGVEAGGSMKRRGTRLESFMSRAEGREGDAEGHARLYGEGSVGGAAAAAAAAAGGEISTCSGGGGGGGGGKEWRSPVAGVEVGTVTRSTEGGDSTLSSLRGRIEELESIVRSYEWEIECSRADSKRAFAMCATHQSGTWFLDMMASHLERVTAAASERLCRAREAGRRRGTWRAWVRYTRRKRRQRRGEGGRGRGGVLLAEMFDDWRLMTLRGKADQVRGYAYVSRLLSAGGGTPKAGPPPVQHWSASAGGKPNGAGGTPGGAQGTPNRNGGASAHQWEGSSVGLQSRPGIETGNHAGAGIRVSATGGERRGVSFKGGLENGSGRKEAGGVRRGLMGNDAGY